MKQVENILKASDFLANLSNNHQRPHEKFLVQNDCKRKINHDWPNGNQNVEKIQL